MMQMQDAGQAVLFGVIVIAVISFVAGAILF